MKLPYVAQQVGNAYFYRLTKIKELSGSLRWMHEGRNLLKPIAGCGLFSHVDPTGWRVTKIWGSEHDHGFVLFLFATTGFHIARSGIFGPQHSCYKGSLLYSSWAVLIIPPASTKLIGGYTGITLSVCPSVDRIVSALYLQQYSLDPFHICTSYQATSEGVSRVMPVSKFKNLKFWRIFKICNFDFVIFWLGIQYDSMVWVIMRRHLQQYSSDPCHICTSYQATSEGVSRVMSVSKFKN